MTHETDKRLCPQCGQENESSAVVCANCGTPLRPSTFPVSNVQLPRTEDAEGKPKHRPSNGGVALWVRNDPHPVLIEPDEGVILGRETDPRKDPPSLINLARYNAYRLGVSRRHAQIECKTDSCLLLDLGSSNGTWINGLKLRPYQPAVLKSGDRVNLARLEFIVGPLTDEARERAGLPTLQLIKDSGSAANDDADKSESGRVTKMDPPKPNGNLSEPADKSISAPNQEHKPTDSLNKKPASGDDKS